MQGESIRRIAFASVSMALFLLLTGAMAAQAVAQPDVVITWQAVNSYAPANYAGKVLPTTGSSITASIQALASTGPINLGGQIIYWYLDDTFLGGGVGAEHVTFHPDGQAPDTMTLRVEVPNFPTGLLISEVAIPVVQPKVVIEAPYPNLTFSGTQAMVQALPYFFATTSTSPLSFAWTANGQAVQDAVNPQSLQISLPQSTPAGYQIPVSLTVENSNDSTSANTAINLTYQ